MFTLYSNPSLLELECTYGNNVTHKLVYLHICLGLGLSAESRALKLYFTIVPITTYSVGVILGLPYTHGAPDRGRGYRHQVIFNYSAGHSGPVGLNRGFFLIAVRDPVPFPTRGACCYRWVSPLGPIRTGLFGKCS